jgi:hypothetical protein
VRFWTGNATAECGDAVDRPSACGLGVVEEPAGAVGEHPLGRELVKDGQEAVDHLAVACMQSESPVVDGQDPDGLLDVVEGGAGQLGPGLAEVLEVHRRQCQRLTSTVEAQPLVAVADTHGRGPLRQVLQLPASGLRQQVVGDPHAEVAAAGKPHNGGVVVRELL